MRLPIRILLVSWIIFAAVMSNTTGCKVTKVPVVTWTSDGHPVTNYAKHVEISPLVEPLGNAASSPWGIPLGTIIVGIGAAALSHYNRRQVEKQVNELRKDTEIIHRPR